MTRQEPTKIEKIRHSLAHILAMAVLEKYPDAKLGIGPTIEHGFYYDFDLPGPLGEDDFKALEKSMRKIIRKNIDFTGEEISTKKAEEMFEDQPYKLDLIKQYSEKGKTLTAYTSGFFTDLCRGGHVDNTKEINPGAFKIMKIAGAYWRGDENNPMLTRIYAVAFETEEELEKHLHMLKEAEKRDHRKLGRRLDLFTFSELVGSGLPLWTPNGTLLRNLLDDYVWQLRKERGYEKVEIPHITKRALYKTSGHWEKFGEELFNIETREGHHFSMKPMNCPHHTQIFKRKKWSYREMPQRYANTTMCYRDEQSGELHGLSRLRAFTQDDAHVFCRKEQVKDEALKIWDIIETFYISFGFEMKLRLSTHDPNNMDNYLGDIETWESSVSTFKQWLEERGAKYEMGIGEAAFYGPKIDFIAKDSLGREWQVATIQVDRNLPERFDLVCVNEDGEDERIVMLHAAIMGSIERFLSILIEHCAGSFPLWLAPTQVRIVSVGEDFRDYAEKIANELETVGVRAEIAPQDQTVGKAIREGELDKIPYLLIVGGREKEAGTVSVRNREAGDTGVEKLETFIDRILKDIRNKT